MFRHFVFSILFLTFCTHSQAEEGFLNYKASLSRVQFDGHFLSPNEFHPQDLAEILGKSGPGVYISVGTERGFIGAALSNSTHLFLFDIDALVVHYNRVSTLLLRASDNMEHYRYLKLNPQFVPDHVERRLHSIVRKPAWMRSVERVRDSTLWRPANIFGHFATANYIQEQHMFTKLKNMADHNRIQSALGDFASFVDMGRLTVALLEARQTISVLDLSNVPDYVTPSELITSLRLLSSAMRADTIVLWTTLWGWDETQGWPYFWAHMKELDDNGMFEGPAAHDWRLHFTPIPCDRLLSARTS